MTDLMAIWDCSLERVDIITEAGRQHSSIDPAESTAQLHVLLARLQQSLAEGQNRLVREPNTRAQTLLLRTRLDLPHPLRPLQWTFQLSPQRASEMAAQILRPCLHELSVSHDKIRSLLGIIKDKDHVISRLLDRIGTSGTDLSLIFPGLTGFAPRKGHVSVAEAAKHVPGMGAFDEKPWSKQFANDDDYEDFDTSGLGNLVAGCEKCFIHTRAQHEDWVGQLPFPDNSDDNDHVSRDRRPKSPTLHTTQAEGSAQGRAEGFSESDDDFEVGWQAPWSRAPGLRS